MQTGAITGYIDVAQLVLYAFWIFFAGLIFWIRREDKREGYPLESDRSDRSARVRVQGLPAVPKAKELINPHGGLHLSPPARGDTREVKAEPVEPWPGAPLEPTGDPLVDGVGPASYAERAEEPDLTLEGDVKILPLRVATDFMLETRDPDPRGMPVVAADGEVAATVTDVWVDKSEYIIRYLEAAVPLPGGGSRQVLIPWFMCRVRGGVGDVRVTSLNSRQFANIPALANPDQVTLREEDKVMGYFGGGYLYAQPSRLEPLL